MCWLCFSSVTKLLIAIGRKYVQWTSKQEKSLYIVFGTYIKGNENVWPGIVIFIAKLWIVITLSYLSCEKNAKLKKK